MKTKKFKRTKIVLFFIILVIIGTTGKDLFVKKSLYIKKVVPRNYLSNNQTTMNLSDWQKAFQEVAFSYYMRGKNIQYNSMKIGYYSPEEATSQNMNYIVCSGLTRNVYYELFGIKTPWSTTALLDYSEEYIGERPEVIAYGKRSNSSNMTMNFSDSTESTNPTLDDILPYLKVGDIVTHTGHTVLVYELIYDNNSGKVIDAIIIEGAHGAGDDHVNIKLANIDNHKLYYNSQENPYSQNENYNVDAADYIDNLTQGIEEGSITIETLSTEYDWKNLKGSSPKYYSDEYSILRFVKSDGNGNPILNYHGSKYQDSDHENNESISLTDADLDRLKFSKLYIEKTVDAHADDIVEEGEKLQYSIVVKNNSNIDYDDDIIIEEDISEYVEYISSEIAENEKHYDQNKVSKVKWNIGKLRRGAEKVITYIVQVKNDTYGNTIISTGKVGEISSSIVKNKIGSNLTDSEKADIISKYETLKGDADKAGKKLVEAIYDNALTNDNNNFELGFTPFDIANLLTKISINTKDATNGNQLNSENVFSDAVLNKYWSAMYREDNTYDLKYWTDYESEYRRADTIYSENFQTGDILIYTNAKDDNNSNDTTTKEHGQYVYIFIEGKGFVGKNLGKDNTANTNDDRNEFTAKYYEDNGLNVYSNTNVTDEDILEYANYQTLFGKDRYVILRPSLLYNKRLEVSTLPTKLEYIYNTENINLTGGKISLCYLNGTTEEVDLTDSRVEIEGFDNSKIGTQTITVKYNGKKATFNVNIIEGSEIESEKNNQVESEEYDKIESEEYNKIESEEYDKNESEEYNKIEQGKKNTEYINVLPKTGSSFLFLLIMIIFLIIFATIFFKKYIKTINIK